MPAPSSPPDPPRPVRSALWTRWLWVWHLAFYVNLVSWVGCLWLADQPPGGRLVAAMAALAATLGVSYGFLVVARPRRRDDARLMTLYLLLAVSTWAGMDHLLPGPGLLLGFVIAAQPFVLVPAWPAAAQALAISAVVCLRSGFEPLGVVTMCWFFALGLVGLTGAWQRAMTRQSAERQRLLDTLGSTRDELASAEREAGVLAERQRLAREIHDTVAQEFISVVVHLEAAEAALGDAADGARRHLVQARRTARHGLAEARRLVAALRPELLDGRPLADALSRLARRFEEAAGTPARLTLVDVPASLPKDLEVTMLRAAQEALANVRKHARAGAVSLTLATIGDRLVLDVQDDGRGFDSDAAQDAAGGGGFGLLAMRERVAQLGGRLVVESAAGEGTTVVVELPIGKPERGS